MLEPPLSDTTSARLVLRRPSAEDVDELFAMYADPRVWSGDPVLRHASPAQTSAAVERWAARWDAHGLGSWVLRTRRGPEAGRLVGAGGCSLTTDLAWNLAFTLRPEAWGLGYAQEVAAAGIACARALRPDLPVTAVVAERNARSVRAVERAGLARVWRGRDPHGSPDAGPEAALLLHADRPVTAELVRGLTA